MKGKGVWGAMLAASLSLGVGGVEAGIPLRGYPDMSIQNLAVPAPVRLSPDPDQAPRKGSFAKNDVIFSFRLDRPPIAWTNDTVSVEAAGKSFALDAGRQFTLSLTDSRMRGRIPAGSVIFCDDANVDKPAGWLAPFFTKFGPETRGCFVDTDGDKRFDKFFLSGTKRAEDSALVDIKPASYNVQERNGTKEEHVDFIFKGFDRSGRMRLEVKRYLYGKSQDYLSLFLGYKPSSFQQFPGYILPIADASQAVAPYDARFFAGASVHVETADTLANSFTGTVTPPKQALLAYFFTRFDRYMPATR